MKTAESIKIKLLLIGLTVVLLSACVTSCQKTSPAPIPQNNIVSYCNPYRACFEGVFRSDTNTNLVGHDTIIPNGKIRYTFSYYSHTNELGNYTIDSVWYTMSPVNIDTSFLTISSQRNLHFKIDDNSYKTIGLTCKSGKYVTFYKE